MRTKTHTHIQIQEVLQYSYTIFHILKLLHDGSFIINIATVKLMRAKLPAPPRKTCGHNISLGIVLGKKK